MDDAHFLNTIEANERNIYILSGVFGGGIAVLLILVGVLFSLNSKLKKRIRDIEGAVEQLLRTTQHTYGQSGVAMGGGGGRQNSRPGPNLPPQNFPHGNSPQNYGGQYGNHPQSHGQNQGHGQGQGQGQSSFMTPQNQQMAMNAGKKLGKFALKQGMEHFGEDGGDAAFGAGMDALNSLGEGDFQLPEGMPENLPKMPKGLMGGKKNKFF